MNASTHTAREHAADTQHRPEHSQTKASEQSEAALADESPESTAQVEATDATGEAAAADAPRPRKPRGFAAMDRSLVSAIARKGGKAAHEAGTAHEFTREEAREAGRKGGQATHAKRRAKSEPQSS